jgi:hypothetical protein
MIAAKRPVRESGSPQPPIEGLLPDDGAGRMQL